MKKRLVLAGIISLMVCFMFIFMTGCAKKTVVKEEAVATKEQAPADKGALKDQASKPGLSDKDKSLTDMASKEQAAGEGMAKEKDALADIYFDFDKYNLKPESRVVLKGNAEWLAKNKDYKLVIEGHCDERGTTEYNLALGERRAAEAMKYMVELGVVAKRMKTMSYGNEMPLDPGHNEEAWAKNRRDHFVVTPQK
jgi:peptidoglycan-associated lipoprotein